MKKSFIFILCAVLFTCCTKTPEQKAEALIKDSVVKHLYVPDSYQPVETQLDSAFAPLQTPEFIKAVLDLYDMAKDCDYKKNKIKDAKFEMSLWDEPDRSEYAKEQYKEAKEKHDELQASYDKLMSRMEKKGKWIKNKMYEEPNFIGYIAYHRFRAKNNAGNTLFGGAYYLINPDLTSIVAEWKEDEINLFSSLIDEIKDNLENADSLQI